MTISKDILKYDYCIPQNLEQLAQHLSVPTELLQKLTSQKKDFFNHYRIPKRRFSSVNDFRLIWESPTPQIADAYKTFLRRFDLFARTVELRYPNSCSYGYAKGRSTFDNALPHCGAPLILHADIKNFFPSISYERILQLFENMGITHNISKLLTDFITIDGELPQGLHPSPLISNLICLDLDDKLNTLAQGMGCIYTRYADDITISGKHVPTKEDIINILLSEGFRLSELKFRITKLGQAHFVTGLSVTDSVPHVPKRMKRQLRQEFYYCKKFGIGHHILKKGIDETVQCGINRLDGTVRYISHVEKDISKCLRSSWHSLMERDGMEVSYEPIDKCVTPIFVFHIDETEIEFGGKKYLALCFVKTQTPYEIAVTTKTILDKYISDPYAMGNKDVLQKNGLHFADSDEDLKKSYIQKIMTFDARAYIVFSELSAGNSYEAVYLSLIKNILPDRLRGCDNAKVSLVYEQNSKVRKNKLKESVDEISQNLTDENDRRPMRLSVDVRGKEDPLFSVPDYILGIFSRYAKANVVNTRTTTAREKAFFEKVRDKCRIILDVDRGIVYSRKRPFKPWK